MSLTSPHSWGLTRTLAYHYDRNGNRTWFDGTSGYYSARTYDGLDRVTSVIDPHGTVVRIGYDAAGRRSGLDSGLTPNSATSLGYDGIGRLASLGHDFAGTGNDVAWSYAPNPASGIGSVTRNNDSYAWTSHYAVNRTYTANGLNQYITAGPATFGYDANGNLAAAPGPDPQETLTYTYDVENRLVGRTGNGPSPTVTLAYDPLGRLWRVQGAAGTTRFLYDGDALAIETDGAGSVLRAFAHGPGTDAPLVWYEVPGGWRRLYPRADHQGSIVAAGGDNGALALINRYDEYGIPAGTNTGRFQYTGQIWLPELGMYHYKARIYSPTLGRFLQVDPIGYDDQFNLYAYVGNNPVTRRDPTGRRCTEEKGEIDCRIDDRGNMTDDQVRDAKDAYTTAVVDLMANPDEVVTITVGDRTMTTTNGDVGRGLMSADVNLVDQPIAATMGGGKMSPTTGTPDGRPLLSIGTRAFGSHPSREVNQRSLVGIILHDGLHTVPQEAVFRGMEDFNNMHQGPYSDWAWSYGR